MSTLSSRNEAATVALLPRVTCPHCWEAFAPEQVLWVSEHVDLLGDPLLGPEQQQRFLPSRFTVEGDAIDAKGMTCHSLACPRCHLGIPRAMVEAEPLFLSILGGPASGKSFFLTAMTWQLRRLLPQGFGIAFTDADPAANLALNDCEESLFLNPREDDPVPLGSLIRKTELQGELYDTVGYGQQVVSYPRPFLFALQPQAGHPVAGKDPAAAAGLSRILCLYDNAGEHFQPGQDRASSPVTRHLAHARGLLFLFDPTQDRRFRAACRNRDLGAVASRDNRLSRQETLLTEAAVRIRKHGGLAHNARYDRPTVVILSKFDEWSHLLGAEAEDPYRKAAGAMGVDVDEIEALSARLREILRQYSPETVAAAEAFATNVTYIAVSALGSRTDADRETGLLTIRPADIRPHWVTVPLLYILCRVLPGLVPRLKRKGTARTQG
ncbi:hypothetical protein OJF2_00090 [Aquisphaera giovannonii]|uniref:Uncharacterized protein n=1 Tax=Aquisphaera giovannonii TaxID=406548 RepID=A0A5B9VTV1_9BACT|nr:hypothetical protein [Aquisphaera giovannonii]QEH31544.1 hypothetical protein OJF2_00090 [Aquisphaera giovannonii]